MPNNNIYGWIKATKQHCSGSTHGTTFSSLSEAEKFCLQQGPTRCSGVYDSSCDGKGSYYACLVKPFSSSSMGSCVYKIPPGNNWIKVTKQHCSSTKHSTGFSSMAGAQQFCLQQGPVKCSGVYDDTCDGKGTFYACLAKPLATSSVGSCVFKIPSSVTTAATPNNNGWIKVTNQHCSGSTHGTTFSSLSEAEKFCLQQGPTK